MNKKHMQVWYVPHLGHALFFIITFFLNSHLLSISTKNEYGRVVETFQNDITKSIMDRVEIYPHQTDGSQKRITRDGLIVRYGKLSNTQEPEATVLICHGFMSDAQDVSIFRRLFPRGKYNVMTFNFRAHGPKERAQGQYCTFGKDEACDVIAAARFLKEYPPTRNKPIFVYAFSMGAVAAIKAQGQEPLFDAMILDCPFQSSHKILKRTLDNVKFSLFGYSFNLPGKSLLREYAFHPYVQPVLKNFLKTISLLETQDIDVNLCPVCSTEMAKNISVPCFFIHCKNDDKIPVEDIKSVFESTNGYKTLWLTNGRRHFDSYFNHPEEYTCRVRNFLNGVLSGNLPKDMDKKIIEDRVDIYGTEKLIKNS